VASVLLCSISGVLLLCFEISLYWLLQVQPWSGGTSKWRWTLGSVGHCQHEGDDQIHEWTTRSVVSSCGSSRDWMSVVMIIITSGQSKGGIAAAFGWFSCIHQVVPVCTPSNTCLLGHTQIHVAKGISIGLAVFAGVTSVRDWQTDRQPITLCVRCVRIGRIYVELRCGPVLTPILMTMFTVLSSWRGHCESSHGSFDECRLSARWPPTLKPSQPTWPASLSLSLLYYFRDIISYFSKNDPEHIPFSLCTPNLKCLYLQPFQRYNGRQQYKNLSGDEIANVNFLCDDIVHAYAHWTNFQISTVTIYANLCT